MLYDNVVLLLVVFDFELVEELVCRFANHHGGEELAAEPRAAPGANGLLDDGDADGRVLAELIGAGETGGTGSDDDDVGVGVGYHVGHVAACHLARDDGFFDGLELEGLKVVRGCGKGHGNRWVLLGGGGFDKCCGAGRNGSTVE